jgi:hypothetical protein
MDENKWYDSLQRSRRSGQPFWRYVVSHISSSDKKHNANVDYYNDHSLTSAEPFVALLSQDDLETRDEGNEMIDVPLEETYLRGWHQSYKSYCKYCWVLSGRYYTLWTKEEASYHMRGK